MKMGKKVVEYLSFLHILGNQVSRFLPERAHIFPSLPVITNIPIEAFLVVLDVPGQICTEENRTTGTESTMDI